MEASSKLEPHTKSLTALSDAKISPKMLNIFDEIAFWPVKFKLSLKLFRRPHFQNQIFRAITLLAAL